MAGSTQDPEVIARLGATAAACGCDSPPPSLLWHSTAMDDVDDAGDVIDLSELEPRLAPLDEFVSGSPITAQVTSIHRFEYRVRYQNTNLTRIRHIADAVASQGLQALDDALRASLIFQLHNLNVEIQEFKKRDRVDTDRPIVKFTFQHDRFHCTFSLYDDRFTLTRNDSDFDTFYEWYSRMMPHVGQVESTIRRIIEREGGQSLEVVQSQFEFEINFGDFETRANVAGTPRRRNVDVLRALIPALPDERGVMRELAEQNFIRLDLSLSRLEQFSNGKVRNSWYVLEAPFNENGRYLVLRAQLRNTSTELPGTDSYKPADVLEFDPDFSDDYRMALIEFLRDRALESYAKKFLETWNFSTPRQI